MRMRYACREVEGTPEPAFAQSQVAIESKRIFSVVIVKWFAFLNKRPQRGRDGNCGNEVATLRRDIEI